jgi:hypothetical protein
MTPKDPAKAVSEVLGGAEAAAPAEALPQASSSCDAAANWVAPASGEEELTLDPTSPAAWAALRATFHEALDCGLDQMEGVCAQPVWRATSDAALELLRSPLPRAGAALSDVLGDFRTHVQPFGSANTHPMFCGWVTGAGTAEVRSHKQAAARRWNRFFSSCVRERVCSLGLSLA